MIGCRAFLAVLLAGTGTMVAAERARDWPVYGGDAGATHYSPLDQINPRTVATLTRAWMWKTGERPMPDKGVTPGKFEATPIVFDDVLYVSTPYNRVAALDAATGAELWTYDPRAYEGGQPLRPTGFVHRGVALWTDGQDRRIFLNTRTRLVALDARTGTRVETFGAGGEVDLLKDLPWPVNPRHYENTSPPVVYKNLVIVGSSVADNLVYRKSPPGDVQAFDVRTGRRVWRFNPVADLGEAGAESWSTEARGEAGHTNVWVPMSLDQTRGLLYVPVSTPVNDYYGGARKGDNLYGDSLVCLEAATGRRRWHFQTVHHGLWDYDGVTTPALVRITVGRKRIDAVAAPSKNGFTYVFDRVTGAPVWPIEERPVPQSDVPGEQTSKTQPFPTKPPPFARQGFTDADLVAFTAELTAEARLRLEAYRTGPLYTPPSLEGTIVSPGDEGGANWGGAAFDPDTGVLYVRATNAPKVVMLRKADPAKEGAEYVRDRVMTLTVGGGIPIGKPPYGVLTALDLNRGTRLWQVAAGDAPAVRQNPRITALNLPPLGAFNHAGSIVTRGGLVFFSASDGELYAVDKSTGRTLWRASLGASSDATPMTFETAEGRQLVVVAVGAGSDAALVAFGLPVKRRPRS